MTQASDWPSWDLTPRQLCDLELLMNGGFAPLTGFLSQRNYEGVCNNMRLTSGELWPIPITLDVSQEFADTIQGGVSVALRDPEGVMLAALHVEEMWTPDRASEAKRVFGTTDKAHPGVAYLLDTAHPVYVSGRLEPSAAPTHYDFPGYRLTPRQLRDGFADSGWTRVVAFQTRNPMHRAHQELTLRACAETDAKLLIHPVVGMTKPGDVDHYTRVRCYQAILPTYPDNMARLALLPLAMRMAGPREALWHALIRKNYGCTHLIVGRDHAGPGGDFYGPYEAQELLREHEEEIGVEMVPFKLMVYREDTKSYSAIDEVPEGAPTVSISGTELRERLAEGKDIPDWFTFPAVAEELRRTHRPRAGQGIGLLFSGLSGAGKSTIANALRVKLLEIGSRGVTLLDGDIVRKNLSAGLGFSKKDRDTNILRVGYVASEIVRHGGIALCANIAPYDAVRKEVRRMVQSNGGFFLVHVSTPLDVCERRDRKGLYAKARKGLIAEFTGISDPYETPEDAEIVIDTTSIEPGAAVAQIIDALTKAGYLG